jgi:NTE family protein
MRWDQLEFSSERVAVNLEQILIEPVRSLAGRHVHWPALLRGLLMPGAGGVARCLARIYDRYLFNGVTLQDIPDRPRFVFNASSAQTNVRWRFTKQSAGDYRVGYICRPRIPLAQVVAASSAFPPFLSPAVFSFAESDYDSPGRLADLHKPEFMECVLLMDGGVYDNLGLQGAHGCKVVLVSDAGKEIQPKPRPRRNWFSQLLRIRDIADNQVRALRKRQLIGDLREKRRRGTYWGITTNIDDYELPDSLPCAPDVTIQLAAIPTGLAPLHSKQQEQLINWGYAVSDAAMRRYCSDDLWPSAPHFPYPDVGVG